VSNSSSSKAFTIIELVVVLVIAAILSGTAIIAINSAVKRIRLDNALDKVASDIRYAQYMASSRALWYGISFEVNPLNRYTIYTTTGTLDTAVLPDPFKVGSTFVINLNTDYGIQISSAAINGGKKVEFRPDGTPFADKTLTNPISTESVIKLTNGSATREVRITPYTGRVYEQ
jgi:prepilin-type N-terminal cleavage/methylation domain-containing protein